MKCTFRANKYNKLSNLSLGGMAGKNGNKRARNLCRKLNPFAKGNFKIDSGVQKPQGTICFFLDSIQPRPKIQILPEFRFCLKPKKCCFGW